MNKLIGCLICAFFLTNLGFAKDKITEIRLQTIPGKTVVRPNESLVVNVQFWGYSDSGGFLSILSKGDKKKLKRFYRGGWTTSLLKENSGWISKPFLYQSEKTKVKSGFGNFIRQGLGRGEFERLNTLYCADETR